MTFDSKRTVSDRTRQLIEILRTDTNAHLQPMERADATHNLVTEHTDGATAEETRENLRELLIVAIGLAEQLLILRERETNATVSESLDYLSALYARLAADDND